MSERTIGDAVLPPVGGSLAALLVGGVAPAGAAVLAATLTGVATSLAIAIAVGDSRYLSLSGLVVYLVVGAAAVEGPIPAGGVLTWALLGAAAVGMGAFAVRVRFGNLKRGAALPYDPSAPRRALAVVAGHLLGLRSGIRRVVTTRERALGLSVGVVAVALGASVVAGRPVAAGALAALPVVLFAPVYVLTDWRALDGVEPTEVPDVTVPGIELGFGPAVDRMRTVLSASGEDTPQGAQSAETDDGSVLDPAVERIRSRLSDAGPVLDAAVESVRTTLGDALASLDAAADATRGNDASRTEPAAGGPGTAPPGPAETPSAPEDQSGKTAPTPESTPAGTGDEATPQSDDPPVIATSRVSEPDTADGGEVVSEPTTDASTEPAGTTALADAPVYTAAARAVEDTAAARSGDVTTDRAGGAEPRERTGDDVVIDAAAAVDSRDDATAAVDRGDDVATDGSGLESASPVEAQGDRTPAASESQSGAGGPDGQSTDADESTDVDRVTNVSDRVSDILDEDDGDDEWVEKMEFLDSD